MLPLLIAGDDADIGDGRGGNERQRSKSDDDWNCGVCALSSSYVVDNVDDEEDADEGVLFGGSPTLSANVCLG